MSIGEGGKSSGQERKLEWLDDIIIFKKHYACLNCLYKDQYKMCFNHQKCRVISYPEAGYNAGFEDNGCLNCPYGNETGTCFGFCIRAILHAYKFRLRMEVFWMDANIQIIGVDNGNSQHKTRHDCFTTGIALVDDNPIVYDNILGYNSKCYRIGGDRIKVQDDKVCNENFYLLTLAAIARELNARGTNAPGKNHIVLAAGLPIGRYSAEKKAFRNYLLKNRMVRFRYEKKEYVVFLEDVLVYPQCYGAIVDRLPMMGGQEIVVDIGSWTIDIMKVIDRVPDQAAIATDPNGIITCMRRIEEVCVAETNTKIDEYMIREFITKGDVRLDQEFVDIMEREFTKYTRDIFRGLAERGINVRTTPITFVGGGAVLMRKYAGIEQKNISYVEDVRANAIGYEILAGLYLNAKGKKEA